MSIIVPPLGDPDPYKSTLAIQQLAQGRSNAAGTVTLTASAATTTVAAQNCGAGSKVFLFPTTANAAAELGAGTCYIATATVTAREFIITHANNAQTDRTFFYVTLG